MRNRHDDTRTPVTINTIGAGRGGERMMPHLAESNRISERLRLDELFVDPAPGKAMTLASKGQELGIRTSAKEMTGEEFLSSSSASAHSVSVVAIDDAAAIGRIVGIGRNHPLFVYFLLDVQRLGLLGMRFIIRPEDESLRSHLSRFFPRLAAVTAPGGAREVFGAGSPARNHLAEPRYRAWFGDHLKQNVGKVLHNMRPESAPAEVTLDGHTTIQIVLMESDGTWRSQDQLVDDLKASLDSPVRRGMDFMVVETGTENIRIHQFRYRLTDGAFAPTRRTWRSGQDQEEESAAPVAEISKFEAAFLSD